MNAHHDITSWQLMLLCGGMLLFGAALASAIYYTTVNMRRRELALAKVYDRKVVNRSFDGWQQTMDQWRGTLDDWLHLIGRVNTWRHALGTEHSHRHIRAKVFPIYREAASLTLAGSLIERPRFIESWGVTVVNTGRRNSLGTDIVLTSGQTYDTYQQAVDAGKAMVTAFRFVRDWGVIMTDLMVEGS